MPETWSFILSTTSFKDSLGYQGVYHSHKFNVQSNREAKDEILKLIKKLAVRLRKKGVTIYVQAMPYMVIEENGKETRILNGERIIRLKDRYSNKRILKINNPDVALVQGYGPTALDKLRQ